ncbi:MAG: formate/nitrite transporter family protein [Acutalibacteraceae bacterium]|jgi:formate/nitrite transporter FocA (FNT family)
MKHLSTLIKSILAGFCIAVGALVYLALLPDHKMLGAFLFGIGLFSIFNFGLSLYTGKIGFLVEKNAAFLPELGITWIGNFIGAAATGWLAAAFARPAVADAWRQKAAALCDIKLGDAFWHTFVLAVFCGFLMFVAGDTNQKAKHPLQRYLATFLPVAVFILAGFEHVVANMAYFAIAGIFSWEMLVSILAATLGNSVGAWLLPLGRRVYDKLDKKAA